MSAPVSSTLEALTLVLEDASAFQQVVDAVFQSLDTNDNGSLESEEFTAYIHRTCSKLGIRELPNERQVKQVFRHLDLDNDSVVTKEELSVFLRHLFREQVKHCVEALKEPASKQSVGLTGPGPSAKC